MIRLARIAVLTLLVCTLPACRSHFHEVDSGRFYRSAQLAPTALERVIRTYGIRTVINLRGCKPEKSWYRDETQVCAILGVEHHDVDMSARRIPHRKELIELLDLYRHCERPILVHCQGGSDRSGLASALWTIEYMGRSKSRARKQLTQGFGHFERYAPSKRYFVTIYEGEDWVYDVYDPCSGEYEHYDVQRYCAGQNDGVGPDAISDSTPARDPF